MKRIALCVLLVALCSPPALPSQGAAAPMVEAQYAKARRSQIVALLNMSEQSAAVCETRHYSGEIVGVGYDNPEATRIGSFGLKLRDGRRELIDLDEGFYSRVTNADRDWLYTILKAGQRVRVKVYLCGAGGATATAEEVHLLREGKRRR